MNTVTITGPKELVAILAKGIYDELRKASPDAERIASMRNGMLAALRLCSVEVRNATNVNDRWS
jgi:hypothetical protein